MASLLLDSDGDDADVYVGRMSLRKRTMSRSSEFRALGLLSCKNPTFPDLDGITFGVNLIFVCRLGIAYLLFVLLFVV